MAYGVGVCPAGKPLSLVSQETSIDSAKDIEETWRGSFPRGFPPRVSPIRLIAGGIQLEEFTSAVFRRYVRIESGTCAIGGASSNDPRAR